MQPCASASPPGTQTPALYFGVEGIDVKLLAPVARCRWQRDRNFSTLRCEGRACAGAGDSRRRAHAEHRHAGVWRKAADRRCSQEQDRRR